MMKPLKFSLRIWIALTSVLSFLGGWALFAHSGKPAPLFTPSSSVPTAALGTASGNSSYTALPTLQPIPSLDDLAASGQVQALPAQPSLTFNNNRNFSAPRMRTRGS